MTLESSGGILGMHQLTGMEHIININGTGTPVVKGANLLSVVV